ncbi:hypothetical protein F5884DRAFT_819467 [Xylogone sp. PMI_703]|nr:hypothetical protein F5884DRAFT_819467 [Xylogone sp. PMI_703]
MLKIWRQMTPYLIFNALVFLQGALLFGIDTGSFGSLQALPSFLNRFGVRNTNGCLGAESMIEHNGYKMTMYIAAGIQIVALTADHWAQFTVGRIIAYSAVGLVENAVPSYNAETSPAAARGLMSASIMLVTGLGNLWGAGMSCAYSTTTTRKGWMIPTAMQFIPAIGLLCLIPFTPESPRWLILKGHKQRAKEVLDKIRTKHEVESGATAAEVDILESIIEESLATEQGSWLDIFRGNYLRRTWISATLFVLEQTNGNQFVQSCAATFYVQQGLGSMSFTYTMIGQVVGVVGCAIGIILLDISGRRPTFIYGSAICAFLLYLASGLGTIHPLNQNASNTLLACFMLLPAFTRISASNNAFLTGAEIGGVRMRKKIMAFGTACDVAAAFLVTFVTPYLLPSMGVNIGWIFGSVAVFSVIWGFLFFPELKGRSLEEVDELFAARLYVWRFKKYETHGRGRLLADIEIEKTDLQKSHIEEIELSNTKGSVSNENT